MSFGVGSELFATSIAPWLAVRDAQEAVDFYRAAFGAVEVYRLEDDKGSSPSRNSQSRERRSGSSRIVTSAPEQRGPGSVRLILSVENPDAVFANAIATGGAMVKVMSEDYGWRTGRIMDPLGYDWEISRQLTP